MELLNSDTELILNAIEKDEVISTHKSLDSIVMKKEKTNKSILKNTSDIINIRKDSEKNNDTDEAKDEDTDQTEFDTIIQALIALKESNSKEIKLATHEINITKKDQENRLKEQEIIKRKKEEKINELNKISESVLNNKKEMNRIDQEIKKKLFESIITKEQSKTELAAKEAKLLEIELKQKRISNIFYDLKQAEKVDICFLVDCTGSMSSYIVETKMVIHQMCDKLRTRFENFDLRMSFVGYRDHSDGIGRVVIFPFSKEVEEFKRFVSSVQATGGADECEDVFGGFLLNF